MRNDVEGKRGAVPPRFSYTLFLHVVLASAIGACHGNASVVRVNGTVEIREVLMSPLTSGRLVRLLTDEGDTVRRGDTIATLEQPGLDALISQRRAQALAAGARTAEIAAALADSQRAANDLRRAVPLHRDGAIATQQLESLSSAAVAAAARLQAVRATTRESAAALAGVAATEAIRDQLTIIAPENGIVLTRYAEPGEAVSSGMPVVSLGLVHEPWIRAYVGESFIARLRLGQPVTVRLNGYERPFRAHITEIASRAEYTPRAALTERERADLVFGIKVAAEGGDVGGRLKAGMPVTVEIPLLP